jgi:hypothetical protein
MFSGSWNCPIQLNFLKNPPVNSVIGFVRQLIHVYGKEDAIRHSCLFPSQVTGRAQIISCNLVMIISLLFAPSVPCYLCSIYLRNSLLCSLPRSEWRCGSGVESSCCSCLSIIGSCEKIRKVTFSHVLLLNRNVSYFSLKDLTCIIDEYNPPTCLLCNRTFCVCVWWSESVEFNFVIICSSCDEL